MPRRPVGVGAIKKDKAAAEKFKAKTAQLQESSFQAMTNQMETFREKLEEFARSHKQEIKKDPEFRRHFQVTFSNLFYHDMKAGSSLKLTFRIGRLGANIAFYFIGNVFHYWCRSISIV